MPVKNKSNGADVMAAGAKLSLTGANAKLQARLEAMKKLREDEVEWSNKLIERTQIAESKLYAAESTVKRCTALSSEYAAATTEARRKAETYRLWLIGTWVLYAVVKAILWLF